TAGSPAERELEMEYYFPPGFYPTNQEPLRAGIGARVSYSTYSRPRARMTGAATASPWANTGYEKASFNVYFTGIFASGGVDYPFFTNYVTKEFNHLRLRAGKNDLWNPFITDELVRRLWLRLGHHGARGLFTTLHVNGVYKGLYNLTERFRQPFFQSHYRSAEDWDLNYSGNWDEGDGTAFSQLLAGLETDLTSPVNWANVTNRLDIDNTVDYFLLNIYTATWDWPGNNYVIARERSVGPNSRFRFAVWDAEGAFASVQDIKPVSYNTITSDLLAPGYYILPQIFRRLVTSPEFRLRFADRVNRHMFNGGVLDDRDPDGAGPQQSRVMGQLEELVAEVGNAVVYNSGTGLRTNNFHQWVAPLTGRRSYLLGKTSGRMMLRSTGFWPVTEPPQFSPFGGTLPAGTSLSITSAVAVAGQTASIFYTLNGPDPRREGGALHSAAIAYSGPLTLDTLATVRARARNDQTGEWSPLTEATYAPDAVRAGVGNLVIAEIMYHPQDAGVAELAAGYNDADDFEFIRLQNVGEAPVDVHGVRFTLGVTFDFTPGAVRYLNPGASVLVVSRPAAFRLRYGDACDAMLAGTYTGNLSNGGELLRLVDATGQTLREVTYLDEDPWPVGADGDGFSLLLRAPFALPDHALPENWTCSRSPGGMPAGVAPAQTFEQWRAACWSVPEV
ncbi:MAG TPA: CotH kinase family protein, partial [Clostridia bacterium]|nr:CotH kinase family protein [Clostridia bacterium]